MISHPFQGAVRTGLRSTDNIDLLEVPSSREPTPCITASIGKSESASVEPHRIHVKLS